MLFSHNQNCRGIGASLSDCKIKEFVSQYRELARKIHEATLLIEIYKSGKKEYK